MIATRCAPLFYSYSLHSLLCRWWAHVVLITTSKYWEWCVWMGTRMIFRMRIWGSFSGLNGPCSDERFFPKKSMDHTLLVENNCFTFSSTTQYYTIYCPQLVSSALQYGNYTITSLSPTAPSEISLYILSDDVMLPEPSTSRSFPNRPHRSTDWECSGSFFTLGWWRSNWYTYHVGYHRIVSSCSSLIWRFLATSSQNSYDKTEYKLPVIRKWF
jgi:hypothetical protein